MKTATSQFSRHVSVPSDQGIRVDKTIVVRQPVPTVYAFWRGLENIPRFMRHVLSVTVQDELHSHWAVKGPGGQVVEWDSEIIEQRDNEMISWRSIPGSEVENAGSVWFRPTPDSLGTEVRVEIKYVPPAGKTGEFVARLFGRITDADIEEDLRRFKSVLELGRLPEAQMDLWKKRSSDAALEAVQAADACVRNNPWTAVMSVAVAFLAIGFLLGRRRKSPEPAN